MHNKSIPNPSKFHRKSIPNGVLGPCQFLDLENVGAPDMFLKSFGVPWPVWADFWDPLKSEGRQKRSKQIQYGDFLVPRGGEKATKNSFGMCLEKNIKNNEKSMRKLEVFYGLEPRLALYSSLITHFRHFRQTLKN